MDGRNFQSKDIEPVDSSIASVEIVESLAGLGLSPRFRYKKTGVLFELWLTEDGTTGCSVNLTEHEDFIDKILEDNEVEEDLREIVSDSLLGQTDYHFSLETHFDDGFILVSMKQKAPDNIKNILRLEMASTAAETYAVHRQAVEKRSMQHKVLYDDTIDDLLAGNYYFLNHALGPEAPFDWTTKIGLLDMIWWTICGI